MGREGVWGGGGEVSKNALKLVYWFKEFVTLTPLIKNKKKSSPTPTLKNQSKVLASDMPNS